MSRTKIYFASDFHLGAPDYQASREREGRVVRWLDMISEDASAIYLLGDIFDFWFEYGTVIPRGFIRLQGKLAELSDSGIKIVMFRGNHDMWMFDYFSQEIGATIVSDELVLEHSGKRFFLHHGDGLGPGDGKYKMLKKVFRSGLCQWLFARIHPNLGIAIAKKWSQSSRLQNNEKEELASMETEWLVSYSKAVLKQKHFDYFVFGHRHLPLDVQLDNSRYINLGEWMNFNSYAVFDGEELSLKYFEGGADLRR